MAIASPALPDHYLHLKALGSGAFGEVWRADGPQGPVAIKVLSVQAAADPAAAWSFAAEFRRLSALDHPAFPKAIEEGATADGLPFYAMTLVEGEALLEDRAIAPERVAPILIAVAEALEHLHGKGLVHGDIKPENLRLGRDGQVALLDVGMVTPVGQARQGISGTLEYLAPEAFRKVPVAPAADWYALGAVAYQLLTGRPPFVGGPTELVRGHLTEAPPALLPQAPQSPPELVALVEALLSKEAHARPSSAPALRAALGESVDPELLAAGPATLKEAPAWGLEGLRSAWKALRSAPPGMRSLAVVGGPATGKSRALEEARLVSLLDGWTWIGSACGAGAGSPAAPLRAVLRQALAQAKHPASERTLAWMEGQSPEDLAELEPAARKMALLTAAGEDLAQAALMLGGLAIGLDDWQLADRAGRDAFSALALGAAHAPLTWILAGSPDAEALPDARFELLPLDGMARSALVEARLGAPAPTSLLAELAAADGGAPGALMIALEELVRTGRLRPTGPAAWVLHPAQSGQSASIRLKEMYLERARCKGPHAARLASAIALAAAGGQASAVGELTDLAGLTQADGAVALDHLVASALAFVEAGRVQLAVAASAEALMGADAEAPVASWASQLAKDRLELAGPKPSLDQLVGAARLALLGEDQSLACDLAGQAGRAALAGGSPSEAAKLLEQATHLLPPEASAATRLALFLPLAEAQRFDDAASSALGNYEFAWAMAKQLQDEAAVASATYGLGKARQVTNDYEGALKAWAEARSAAHAANQTADAVRALVAEGRMRLFRGEPGHAADLAKQAADLAQGGHPAILAQALNLRAIVRMQEGASPAREAATWLKEAASLSTSIGDRVGEMLALDNLGNAHLAAGELAQAAEAFDATARHADALGMPVEGLFAELNLALVALERGATSEGEGRVANVLRRAAKAGRKYPAGVAKAASAGLAWRSGRPQEALAQVAEALAIAEGLKHKLLEEFARNARLDALLALGQVAEAQQEVLALAEVVKATDHAEMRNRLLLHQAELARQLGQAIPDRQALQAFAVGDQPIFAHRAHQLLAHFSLAEGHHDLALDHAESARCLAARWQSDFHESEALSIKAQAALAAGDKEAAADIALEACTKAQTPGQCHPLALAVAALVLQKARGRADAAEAFDTSAALLSPAFSALGEEGAAAIRKAWGLEDWAARPAAMPSGGLALDANSYAAWLQAIATAQNDQEAAEMALDAVAELTSADRGYVLAYESGRLQSAVTRGMDFDAEVNAGYSTSIASEALFAGEAIYLTNAGTSSFAAAKSVVALELKTVLALPLSTANTLLGVVYVDRNTIEPVLSPAEVGMLHALVGQAAATMIAHRRVRHAEAELGKMQRLASFALTVARRMPLGDRRHAFLDEAMALVGADRALWLERDVEGAWTPFAGREAGGKVLGEWGELSQGVADWVFEQGRGTCLIDGAEDESWRERASVQALGLRTVWAVPAGEAVVYLDAGLVADGDPLEALGALESFAAAAAPELAG